MFNITGKFVTVFQPRIDINISEKIVFANLSTSKKNTKDGKVTYENMSWKGCFVGKALEPSKGLHDGDKIDITRGMVTNKYDKEKKQLYVNVTIFEFALSPKKSDASDGSNNEGVEGK